MQSSHSSFRLDQALGCEIQLYLNRLRIHGNIRRNRVFCYSRNRLCIHFHNIIIMAKTAVSLFQLLPSFFFGALKTTQWMKNHIVINIYQTYYACKFCSCWRAITSGVAERKHEATFRCRHRYPKRPSMSTPSAAACRLIITATEEFASAGTNNGWMPPNLRKWPNYGPERWEMQCKCRQKRKTFANRKNMHCHNQRSSTWK